MIVHCPAAVGHYIGEGTAGGQILLGEHIVALVAAAFAFAGQEAHPLQLPIIRAVIATVFDMIPHAKGDFEQLHVQRLRVGNGILLAAQLNPPEVHARADEIMVLVHHAGVIGIDVRPFGRGEGAGMIGLPGFDQAGIAHRFAVSLRGSLGFAQIVLPFSAHAVGCAAQRGQDAVARAIQKDLRFHGVEGIGIQLPAGNGRDAVARSLTIQAGAVEQQGDVLFRHHGLQ